MINKEERMSLIQDGPIAGKKREGQSNVASAPPALEINEQNFMEILTQTSMQMPVVVAFYSMSSPASQKMKTQLEAIIEQAGIAIQLATLDIDKNQMLASQLQISSVPTVMAFYQAQPLDGFAGPQDDNFIRQFLGRISGQEVVDPNEMAKEALKMAQQAFDAEEYEQSVGIIQQILQAIPSCHAAVAMLLRVYAKWQGAEAVQTIIDSLSEEQKQDKDVQSALKTIELSKNAVDDDALAQLKQQYENNPQDLDIHIQLAEAYMGQTRYREAMDILFISFKQDSTYKESMAKKKLLDIFEALGGEDALTQQGRKKLASLLF